VAECLPSKCEILSSNPSITKKTPKLGSFMPSYLLISSLIKWQYKEYFRTKRNKEKLKENTGKGILPSASITVNCFILDLIIFLSFKHF
jgi:hypothetical protein